MFLIRLRHPCASSISACSSISAVTSSVVKVGRGKAYRIKHWFSLKSFEMVDTPQDTGVDLVFLARGEHICGWLVALEHD